MRKIIGGVALAWLLVTLMPEAAADVVASSTDGTTLNATGFYGQSFTTTTPQPETDIIFNFYSNVPATTPAAFGTGFLLSQQYLGTPAALSSATPGFLAEATASGGEYSFGSAATLLPSTQYFFYENASIPSGSISGGQSDYSGGNFYRALASGADFGSSAPESANFLVQGTAAVPEPSGLAVVGVAAGVHRASIPPE